MREFVLSRVSPIRITNRVEIRDTGKFAVEFMVSHEVICRKDKWDPGCKRKTERMNVIIEGKRTRSLQNSLS